MGAASTGDRSLRVPKGAVVDTARRRAYVACSRINAVTVLDLVAGVVGAEVPVGREPRDIGCDDVTGRLFVADLRADTVSAVDSRALLDPTTWARNQP